MVLGILIYTSFLFYPATILRKALKVRDFLIIFIMLILSIFTSILGGLVWMIVYPILIVVLSLYYTRKPLLAVLLTTSILVVAAVWGLIFNLIVFSIGANMAIPNEVEILVVIITLAVEFFLHYTLTSRLYKYLQKDRELAVIASIMFFVFYLGSNSYNYFIWDVFRGENSEVLIVSSIFSSFCFLLCLVTLIIRAKTLKTKKEQEQLEFEVALMEIYIKDVEIQYSETRKIRHDFHNILQSLDYYIEGKKFEELSEYYEQNIRLLVDFTEKQQIIIERLALVKTLPIKSIVYSKILEMSENRIDYSLEINEEIKIDIENPINCIRALGIILDNAQEEVAFLGQGIVGIAIFSQVEYICIIVENDCRTNIPNMYQLKESGFTTKENHQGIGLNSLYDIASSSETLFLETIVNNGKFTQILKLKQEEYNV